MSDTRVTETSVESFMEFVKSGKEDELNEIVLSYYRTHGRMTRRGASRRFMAGRKYDPDVATQLGNTWSARTTFLCSTDQLRVVRDAGGKKVKVKDPDRPEAKRLCELLEFNSNPEPKEHKTKYQLLKEAYEELQEEDRSKAAYIEELERQLAMITR